VGVTGFGAPDPADSEEARHAVSAATQARAELLIDGRAPGVEGILSEMGRDADGIAVEPDADAPHEASEAARRLLGYDDQDWDQS
jgi:hypothetical protein